MTKLTLALIAVAGLCLPATALANDCPHVRTVDTALELGGGGLEVGEEHADALVTLGDDAGLSFQAGSDRLGQHVQEQTLGPGLFAFARPHEVLQQREGGGRHRSRRAGVGLPGLWGVGVGRGGRRARHPVRR